MTRPTILDRIANHAPTATPHGARPLPQTMRGPYRANHDAVTVRRGIDIMSYDGRIVASVWCPKAGAWNTEEVANAHAVADFIVAALNAASFAAEGSAR